MWGRALGILALSLSVAACAHDPARPVPAGNVAAPGCATGQADIRFDFDGASQSACVIEGERAFRIVVTPEHAPPINPSPWYAFRYHAEPGADVTISIDYLYGKHRYPAKLSDGQGTRVLPMELGEDGKVATFALPPGRGIVSGQEVFDAARYARSAERLSQSAHVGTFTLGQSRDGLPIDAIRMGDPAAPHLLVFLGRAHPPEVSGAVAMEAFLDQIVSSYDAGTIDPAKYQVLAVPMLNPDGVKRGHWRANRGGKDLNRDWGEFTQPETAAVGAWLDALDPAVRPVLMVDFHSTQSNLFYVQGAEETDAMQEAFLNEWLGGNADALAGYAFTIERRNANPGSGTSKNWFNEKFGIPAYTYEVGDESDRVAVTEAARVFAQTLLPALDRMVAKGDSRAD